MIVNGVQLRRHREGPAMPAGVTGQEEMYLLADSGDVVLLRSAVSGIYYCTTRSYLHTRTHWCQWQKSWCVSRVS